MTGHIRQRGKGNWYAVIDRPDPATGKHRFMRILPQYEPDF
jgi:hypothetical protein